MICYVDGSCRGNGSENNIGGFGVVILDNDNNFVDCYQKENQNTTNNLEELRAILYVLLKYGKQNPCPIVYSDSAYCVNSLTDWIYRWANNHWIKSDKKPPENLEIMKVFYEYFQQGYKIDLRKVRGHIGIEYNELADGLATGKLSIEEIRRSYNGE